MTCRNLPATAGLAGCTSGDGPMMGEWVLKDGWRIRAVADVEESGEVVSSAGFDTEPWIEASVPTTPMAALVNEGAYPDLYMGMNLTGVETDQFSGPWWYRTEIDITAEQSAYSAQLVIAGANYSADVWLNGERLASSDQLIGAYRVHRLPVSDRLIPGKNALAIAVHPPEAGDFTIGFVDWNPKPPDLNMGLWRPVSLRFSGVVSLDDVHIQTDVDTDSNRSADVTVSAVASNQSDGEVTTTITGVIEEITFSAKATLPPGESRTIVFSPEHHPDLRIESPRLWWPHTMGSPELYDLELTAAVDGQISDATSTTFGIRSFATYLNQEGHRGFTVNGEEILIRGGGWVDDLLLSDTPERIDAQLAYVRQMRLNTIRLEGFWGSSHYLYDAADRAGILIMPGWSCQWEWENYLGKPVNELYGGVLEPEEMDLVAASLADQIRYLRNHPSIFTWVLASDLLPHPDLERRYVKVLAETDPTRPPLVSCGWHTSEISGPSGVKMSGPYDWVPPRYWWEDRSHGGAYGFNTETGPGPQPPPRESVLKMIPAEDLWPMGPSWDFHNGRNEFDTMDRFVEALEQRYGAPSSLDDFLVKAQVASYEAIRPMFESFAAERPRTTGLIQWMLNSAWPETYWQLYDWYLMPNGAFYGTRTACQPVSLTYDYAEASVVAINDTRHEQTGLIASIRAVDLHMNELLATEVAIDLDPGRAALALSLAELESPTKVWFLDLRLRDTNGREVARNFYWLPAVDDELDYDNSLWFVTPVARHADLAALNDLPQVTLDVVVGTDHGPSGAIVRTTIGNPGPNLAFFTELRVVDSAGATILPVLWDDNYVSIMPGEHRTLSASLPTSVDPAGIRLEVQGWNSPAVSLEIP